MTFKKQKLVVQQLDQVKAIFTAHQFDSNKIDRLSPLAENFEIRVPFIGNFSSGKSSLLNKLLAKDILATEITPETAVATELRYGSSENLIGYLKNGGTKSYSLSDINANAINELFDGGLLSLQLNSSFLAENPHLVLVDMPGWDSGVEAHHQVIDAYAHKSLAYVVVIQVKDGTLKESLRKALIELALHDKPVIVALSKTDQVPDDDVVAIKNNIEAEIRQLMGQAPKAVVLTSSRKGIVEPLQQALRQLEREAESIFENSVVKPWINELDRIAQLLAMQANEQFNNGELLQAEIAKHQSDMRELDKQIQNKVSNLQQSVNPIVQAVVNHTEKSLLERLERLTDYAMSGSDIKDDVTSTVRVALTQAIKKEFEPSLQHFFKSVDNDMSNQFNLNLTLPKAGGSKLEQNPQFRWKVVGTAFVGLATKIPHPIGLVVAAVLPIIGVFLDDHSSKKRQEIAAIQQREKVKAALLDQIKQVVTQVEPAIRPILFDQIEQARELIVGEVASTKADIEKTLALLQQQLAMGEQELAQKRQQAQQDLQKIQSLIQILA